MQSIQEKDRLYTIKDDHILIFSQSGVSIESGTDIATTKRKYSPLNLHSAKNAPDWIQQSFGIQNACD